MEGVIPLSNFQSIFIDGREFSSSRACIIAEVAQAHDGSLGIAHAFIDAAADSGVDAIKFQTHIAVAESTMREKWRVKFSLQDATRYDYWKRMEFTAEQWNGLRKHAVSRNLIFLSSPFSIEAVDLLERIGMPAWKVASGEVSNEQLLRRMLATRKPMLISSGMSSVAEMDQVIGFCQKAQVKHAVFQCTTAYPCAAEQVGLNQVELLRARYGIPVGLSDHSGVIYPALAAAALRVEFIEVHVTFHRKMFGPDVPASLTFEQLSELVEGVRFIERMRRAPTDKDAIALSLAPLRDVFGKSVVARTDLLAGQVLAEGDLALKKPGDGLPPSEFYTLVGKTLKRSIRADQALQLGDFI